MFFRSPVLLLVLSLGAAVLGLEEHDKDQRVEINFGDSAVLRLMRQIGTAQQSGNHRQAKLLKEQLNNLMEGKTRDTLGQWRTECSATADFQARVFVTNDPADPPEELKEVMPFLDEYWRTDDGEDIPYPGDLEEFMHEDGFRILRADYGSLPPALRKWREDALEEGSSIERKFIAVQGEKAYFAPGIVAHFKPLFATQGLVAGESACQDELLDSSNFYDPLKRVTDEARFQCGLTGTVQVGSEIGVQIYCDKKVPTERGISAVQELQDLQRPLPGYTKQ